MQLKRKVIKKEIVTKPEVKRGSFLVKAKAISEIEDFWTALLYGRSGTGKTTLAATFPKDIIHLDFKDKGTNSIRNVKGIKTILMNDWSYVEGVYWDLKESRSTYKTVIIDTVDGMQKLAMAKVKEDNGKDEAEALSQREWGEISGLMNQWIFFYRDLPMNVVFLSQQRIKSSDEENGDYDKGQLEPEVGPALMPSVAQTLNAAVNIIGNTYIKQNVKKEANKTTRETFFMLRIGPHPFYITKIRKPKEFVVPQAISNPSYDKLMKITRGEKL
jgi:hypothetical protein